MKKLQQHLNVILTSSRKNSLREIIHYQHYEDNYVEATDSHRVLRMYLPTTIGQSTLYNNQTSELKPDNLDNSDSNVYPNINKLFEPYNDLTSTNTYQVVFNTTNNKDVIAALKHKDLEKTILVYSPDHIDVHVYIKSPGYNEPPILFGAYELISIIDTPNDVIPFQDTAVTGIYIVNLLNFITDFEKDAINKDILLHWKNPRRPLYFQNEAFDYILAPVRINS